MISRSATRTVKRAFPRFVAGALAALALAACAAGPGASDNPILRKFQWFSYLEGGDFKPTCAPGADDIYRMVYNAQYSEQVRIYELRPNAAQPGGTLYARVFGRADLRSLHVQRLNDLLNPWRGQEAVTPLGAGGVQGLVNDLQAAGAFGQPNVGEQLSSRGFFWTIAACHDGQYHFTGFSWPGADWERARFPGRLFSLDETGVPVRDPRAVQSGRDLAHSPTSPLRPHNEYHLKVGEDGLAGFEPLL